MERKNRTTEDKEGMRKSTAVHLENGVELPSFGLSAFCDMTNAESVKQVLKNIRKGSPSHMAFKPVTVSSIFAGVDKVSYAASAAGIDTSVTTTGDELLKGLETKTVVESSPIQAEDTEGEVVIHVTHQPDPVSQSFYPLPFTAGGTEPLGTDTTQIITYGNEISESELFGECAENMMSGELPSLSLKTAGYSRFRYQSERNTGNRRPRQYEMDEDKRCLAEVQVNNYQGPAKVIVYCVNSSGKLHPYNLFGTDCNKGVFVRRVEFSKKQPFTKLLKVSITTPKTKEYSSSVREQQAYLEELNVITDQEVPDKCDDNGDKQVVYLMVKVILETVAGTMLSSQSKEIRNKKEGTEFKIRSIHPSCVPITGPCGGNPDKNKVCIIVTDNTAFPKDVCVVLRKQLENGKQWTRVLNTPQIEVIRKSVVEFSPPPYRDPDSTTDVDVELYLKDLKTSQETDPVILTYIGTDEYGLKSKGKKRKLDILEQPTLTDKTLHLDRTQAASKKRSGKDIMTMDEPKDSTETPLRIVYDQTAVMEQGIPIVQFVSEQEPVVSVGAMRGQGASNEPGNSPMLMHLKKESASPQIFQAAPQNFQAQRALEQSNVQTSALTQIDVQRILTHLAQQQGAFEGHSEGQINGALLKLIQEQSSSGVQNVAVPQPTTPQPVLGPAFSQRLPKLEPNQMFAMIKGQIVIINDDTKGLPTTSGSISVQNNRGLNVNAKGMSVQQPLSTDRREVGLLSQQGNELVGGQQANSGTQQNFTPFTTTCIWLPNTDGFQQSLAGSMPATATTSSHAHFQMHTDLEDNDIEIDAEALSETDQEQSNTTKSDSELQDKSFKNLPRIISDSSCDVEEDRGKANGHVNENSDIGYAIDELSNDEENM